ncbi:DUF5752 family protein [Candidatus Woesearchaeota archaeon]|nr:DUF5752 family protein [Candidatus Woesearchaeota archaeon]
MKALKKVEAEKRFEAIDGSVITDLITLAETLEDMSDDSYYYHVQAHKNDFSTWVRECLELPELAEQMENSDTREGVVIKVLKFVIKELHNDV